jgi:hypothetical protein
MAIAFFCLEGRRNKRYEPETLCGESHLGNGKGQVANLQPDQHSADWAVKFRGCPGLRRRHQACHMVSRIKTLSWSTWLLVLVLIALLLLAFVLVTPAA